MPSQTAEKKIRKFIEAVCAMKEPHLWIDSHGVRRGDVTVAVLAQELNRKDGTECKMLSLSLRSLIAKRWPKRKRAKRSSANYRKV